MGLQDLTPQLRTRLMRVEKIVGLFVGLATLVLLAGFVYYLHHTAVRKGWFIPKCQYYTFGMSGEGLNVGDPVMLMGFTVGAITEITAQPPGSYYRIYIGFAIKQPYYGYVWSDSKVKIAASGFLGSRRLEVTAGAVGIPTVYEKNGRIEAILVDGRKVAPSAAPTGPYVPPEEAPSVSERAEKLVGAVEQALPNILSLTNEVHTILTNTAALTARLDGLVADARPVVGNLAGITTNLRNPQGSLGEWLIPTNLHAQLSTTLGSANATVTNANAQILLLGASLNQTLLNLAAITSNLNLQVQSNDQILNEISSLVIQTDDLMQGLKRHWLLRGAFPATATSPPPAQLLEPQIGLPEGGRK